jgi:NAD(P)-dependent dehydrogenase (short-subunit alcohol dehydrogenase family)
MGAWYHAGKFAVEGLSDALRLELKRFGINVVLIEPGSIHTEWGGIAADKLRATSGHGPCGWSCP